MNFDLSDEQKAIQALCRDFAREVVAPAAEELDREARFPYEIVAKMAELGLDGIAVSRRIRRRGRRHGQLRASL